MKKAIFTFGLLSMVMVLTSFTTPNEPTLLSQENFSRDGIIFSASIGIKLDNEPGGGTPSAPKKMDYERLLDYKMNFEPGGGTPSAPQKVD
ncbi:MAG TPA: hypothetical protein VF581_10930 [Flavobacterium sp.]|jgi:hypothetical protein